MFSESPAVASFSAAQELPGAGTPATPEAEKSPSLNAPDLPHHPDQMSEAEIEDLKAQIEASLPAGSTHLSRSASGLWYFRLKVPDAIREAHPHLPKEIRRSTKTRHRCHALAISRKMCLDFFIRYKKLETSVSQPDKKIEIASAPNSFVLTGIDGKITISASQIDFAMLQKLADIVKILEARLAANDANFAAPVQPPPVTASVPQPLQVQPPHSVITPEKAVQPVVQVQVLPVAQTTVVELPVACAAPHVVSSVPAAPAVPVADPAPAASVSVPSAYAAFDTTSPAPVWLSDAIEDWRLNGPNRFSEESWLHTYAATFRVLREVIGNTRRTIKLSDGGEQHHAPDIRVCEITRDHIVRFHEALKVLPGNKGHNTAIIEALVRIREREKNKQPLPSAHSVEKKLGHIQPFFKYAKQSKWMPADVWDVMELARKSAAAQLAKEERRSPRKKGYCALNTDELRKLFGQTAFSANAKKKPWTYWIPLLCLYQGMRVSEASQLYTDDVITIDGIPCISLIEDSQGDVVEEDLQDVASSSAEYRRLKNMSSRRTLPVHPKLIELGFLKFWESIKTANPLGPVHMFPQLRWESKQMFGRAPSRHIIQLMKNVEVYVTRYKVAHSLRSNFNQALTATQLQADLISIVLGHTNGSMKNDRYNMADYGPALPFPLIVEYMEKMEFGLDLKPLECGW